MVNDSYYCHCHQMGPGDQEVGQKEKIIQCTALPSLRKRNWWWDEKFRCVWPLLILLNLSWGFWMHTPPPHPFLLFLLGSHGPWECCLLPAVLLGPARRMLAHFSRDCHLGLSKQSHFPPQIISSGSHFVHPKIRGRDASVPRWGGLFSLCLMFPFEQLRPDPWSWVGAESCNSFIF